MRQQKTYRQLWEEFLPLSLSDVVMALSDPLTSMAVTRLPMSHLSLAALGIAKPIAILFESPVIMVLHASNALASRKTVLRRFVLWVGGTLTIGLLLLCIPSVFQELGEHVFGLEKSWIVTANKTLLFFVFWPLASAWRRYYQGLLIHAHYLREIARASVFRLVLTAGVLSFSFFTKIDGWMIGGAALLAGIIGEAIAVTIASSRRGLLNSPAGPVTSTDFDTLGKIWRYYRPLASSMIVLWGSRAAIIVGVARAVDGEMALVAWPVAWGFVILVSNATRMVQQIVIRNSDQPNKTLIRFGLSVGALASSVLLFFSAIPMGRDVLIASLGNDGMLVQRLLPALQICTPVPLLVALQNVYQGLLIRSSDTKFIHLASCLGALLLLSALSIGVLLKAPGIVSAAAAVLGSAAGELIFLARASRAEAAIRNETRFSVSSTGAPIAEPAHQLR